MNKPFLIVLLVPNLVFGKLMLFSDDVYLGCLDCSSISSDSVCNSIGRYGSSISSNSIWNSIGKYGSSISSKSPWNSISSNGPKIVDDNGRFYGRFSINTISGFSQSSDLYNLYNNLDGDLDKVRDAFCR
jgi:hypothetical protein